MEKLKETKEYTVFKKRSGRYAVKDAGGNWLNGNDKVKVLNKEGFVKGGIAKPKPKVEEPPAEKAPAQEAAAEETPAEEAAGDSDKEE